MEKDIKPVAPTDCVKFIKSCCALDLECNEKNEIFALAACCDEQTFSYSGLPDLDKGLHALKQFSHSSNYLLGHNLLRHDLALIDAYTGQTEYFDKPIIDTLFLSPLAFPENPYHRLVKDYKLVRDGLNDPLLDAKLALKLFKDQWCALSQSVPIISFYHFAFNEHLDLQGTQQALLAMGAQSLTEQKAIELLIKLTQNRVCQSALDDFIQTDFKDHHIRPATAYCVAWLRVAGGNSVLPPWVRLEFKEVSGLLTRLRDIPCQSEQCQYCRETHNPVKQLQRYFGFDAFRKEPKNQQGASLQQDIVQAAMTDRALFAILPTGGGKSICFQLPALVRYQRRATLTIVISPLQALMKDQVDNLCSKTGSPSAAALNGLLTMPERGAVLKAVQMGDIALLYISPEQLRNRSFQNAIAHREIGGWVFDEAHCLSKWGHDFRPDYLYAARFIKEHAIKHGGIQPPIQCFTATAKLEVKEEICTYFATQLGQQLTQFEGGVERDNLQFEVQTVTQSDKYARIHSLLTERLDTESGSAIIYCATRKGTEAIAEFLQQQGWQVDAFHAGKNASEKKHIQENFINNYSRIITATNAFGMGIDKDDVRLVIHADIPGSLENYLQEAGRAGRDRQDAECVLLYDQQDIETQFKLSANSQLNQRDIAQLLKGLRKSKKDASGQVVLTSLELLEKNNVNTSFDQDDHNATTKVVTAIAWLERAGYIERNENRTQVFQGRPLVKDLKQAEQKLLQLKLSGRQQQRWLAILEALFNAEKDQSFSADELAQLSVFDALESSSDKADVSPAQQVIRTLYDMTAAGMIEKNLLLTAFVRHQGKNSSTKLLRDICQLERAMLALLKEQAPDSDDHSWQILSLRHLNQHLLDAGQHTSNPEILRKLLTSISYDGQGLAGNKGSISLRHRGLDHYAVKLLREWPALIATAERRQAVTQEALETILAKIPKSTQSTTDLLVEFSAEELMAAVQSDLVLGAQLKDPLAAVERALNFMHEQQIITLQNGLAVFRQAMTIQVLPEAKNRRYNKGDYQPLSQHYSERIFQVHVINEYAQQALQKIGQALAFVLAYFAEDKKAFVERYFSDQKEIYQRATSQQSFQRIVSDLQNPEQISLVAAGLKQNSLILAGPGSGKTKVVVHRCAYLLRVQRIVAESILILCFNRSAASEVKMRLRNLIGDDANGITVQTYHGFSLQISGHTLEAQSHNQEAIQFDEIIQEAIDLLTGKKQLLGMEADNARDRLLAGYQVILVDEYQDIDQLQYQLVAAIAGRTAEQDNQLAILAVGDDDQNIYHFRGTNTRFIKQFEQDYHAQTHTLIENYRSSAHIIAAANQLIAHNHDRMKVAFPIRINQARKSLPPGGRWQTLDPVAKGRVQITMMPRIQQQAMHCIAEFKRLRQLDNRLDWSNCAILAKEWRFLMPLRAALEASCIPFFMPPSAEQMPPLPRIREHATLLKLIKDTPEPVYRASHWLAYLKQQLQSDPTNNWWSGLYQLIKDWQSETGNHKMLNLQTLEYLYQAFAEQRRLRRFSKGIWISTIHACKGTEFDHVLVLDGSWNHSDIEEQRRLYYVAMTRAKQTLALMQCQDANNRLLGVLEGEHILKRSVAEASGLLPVPSLHYTTIGLQDIHLSYPATFPQQHDIHQKISSLRPGSSVILENRNGKIVIIADQTVISVLSQHANQQWQTKLHAIISVNVFAMIRRYPEDSAEQYRNRYKVKHWEVPMLEIKSRPTS